VKGELEDYSKYNGFTVALEKSYKNYEVQSAEFSIKKRNTNHSFYLGILKYIFVSATFLTLFLFF